MVSRRSAIPRPARFILSTVLLSIFCLVLPLAHSQDVLTYHNNNNRTGLNPKETTLTVSNVNSTSFGKLFTIPVDGLVDAQPLYLSAVTIAGVSHNLLVVATEHDSVYTFDADTGMQIWRVSTLKTGETTSDNRGCEQVSPEIGITSTPVIHRPSSGDPVIYVVAMSKDSAGKYHQRLHALDAINGAEVFKGPVEIQAKYPGTGDNSSAGYVVFDPSQYKERAGLLWLNGVVYLAWASHCDYRPYTGWVMGYNGTTLAQTTVLNLTPNGNEGAIWGAGAGMSSDTAGNIFLLVANGVFDSTLNASGFPAEGDYGNAFVRLSTTNGLAVADYFEMSNQAAENGSDTDLGSGGPLVNNQTDSSGTVWQLAIGAGKDGNLYIVDRTQMGKFHSGSNQIHQELTGALPGGIWSSPALYAEKLYYGPVGSSLLAFEFQNAKLLPTPIAKTAQSFGYPGATPSISANVTTNGIVWVVENAAPAVLHAFNANNLAEIYNSSQAADNRDQFGPGNKFITPTIVNGKVYVGTTNSVAVFGLLK